MHWTDDFEMDDDGRLREKRKRVLPDGARITFATISDHAALGFSPRFSDGSIDWTDPHRPGYRFCDVGDPDRAAAEQAYRDRSRRMQDGWRNKGDRQDEQRDRDAAPRALSLDDARAAADAAREARNERLRNGWRRREAMR